MGISPRKQKANSFKTFVAKSLSNLTPISLHTWPQGFSLGNREKDPSSLSRLGRYLLLAPSPFPSSFCPDRLLLSFVRSIHLSSCRSEDVASTSPSSNGVLEKISEGGVTLAKFSYFLASRKILFLWQQVEVVKGTIFFGKFVLVCLANRFRRCR